MAAGVVVPDKVLGIVLRASAQYADNHMCYIEEVVDVLGWTTHFYLLQLWSGSWMMNLLSNI